MPDRTPTGLRSVAYFSMEIGIDENIRTYSGGLGILAGDTIRSAADLNVPMVARYPSLPKGLLPPDARGGWLAAGGVGGMDG